MTWKIAVMAVVVVTGTFVGGLTGIRKLGEVQAQAPATLEPERWEDPEYPVACYRSPGDVAWSCVALPVEEYEEEPSQ